MPLGIILSRSYSPIVVAARSESTLILNKRFLSSKAIAGKSSFRSYKNLLHRLSYPHHKNKVYSCFLSFVSYDTEKLFCLNNKSRAMSSSFPSSKSTTTAENGKTKTTDNKSIHFPQPTIVSVSKTSEWTDFPYQPLYDSHLHVWSDGSDPFPYASSVSPPPENLIDTSNYDDLLANMNESGVQKALIVQPINHLYDHKYLSHTLTKYPTKFKGMLTANPTLQTKEEVHVYLDEILNSAPSGTYVGIRYNPYLWPMKENETGEKSREKMSNEIGSELYKLAGEKGLSVGFMCFTGLNNHYDDIIELMENYPKTKVIIDHFGFFHQNGEDQEDIWCQLLSLARFPQVHVKISAFFRNTNPTNNNWPYSSLLPRLEELNHAFGSERLMFGSDYPYVKVMGGGYYNAPRAVLTWYKEIEEDAENEKDKQQDERSSSTVVSRKPLQNEDFHNIFSGTFSNLFLN